MNQTSEVSVSPAARGFRRVAPAFALFFTSPFVAEMLLGDISIDAIWVMLVVAPLYGGGAVVVRETTRRLGLGGPTMLLLALAYGIFEEGVVLQTLFNPNYLGLHLLSHGYVPALGVSAWWTPFVLTLHTVWSISVPIVVIEALFAERRTQPWLGGLGLGVAVMVLGVGAFLMYSTTRKQDPFAASNLQLISAWIALVLVVGAALRWRPKSNIFAGTVPGVWAVGAIAMVLGIAFMKVPYQVEGWPRAGAQGMVDVAGFALLFVFTRRAAWTSLHTLAAAGGLLLAYAYHGFGQVPVVGSKGTVDLIGNAVFALVALVLLALAVRKERSLAAARGAV